MLNNQLVKRNIHDIFRLTPLSGIRFYGRKKSEKSIISVFLRFRNISVVKFQCTIHNLQWFS